MKILIAGQGLSGTILALTLSQSDHTVTIADPGTQNNASHIAAGIVNPVTGKRWTPSWLFQDMHPVMLNFYRHWEQTWKTQLYHPTPIIRLFADADDRQTWRTQRQAASTPEIFGEERKPGSCGSIKDPFGSAYLTHGGWLNTSAFLQNARAYFEQNKQLQSTSVQSREVNPNNAYAKWKGQRFDRVIFCEGYQGKDNLWFPGMGLAPARGDILTLKTFEPFHEIPDAIIIGKQWLLPMGHGQFKAGSTYTWDRLESAPAEIDRQNILSDIKTFCPIPFSVLKHHAGIRPASRDRKPLIGPSKLHPSLYTFNGFGSKGVLQIPYWAKHLTEVLNKTSSLDPNVHIARLK